MLRKFYIFLLVSGLLTSGAAYMEGYIDSSAAIFIATGCSLALMFINTDCSNAAEGLKFEHI